jgi:hypothetical protein
MANEGRWCGWITCALLVLGTGCADDSPNPPAVNPPKEICDNQADDDGDGKADCDDGECAGEPLCAAPGVEVCDNKSDDDGDGKADCDDADCSGAPNCAAAPVEVCDNGLDDDGDGMADCDDPACAGEPGCGTEEEVCDNKSDDDGDGKVDCDDADCAGEPSCVTPPAEVCDNDLDDDGNGKTDCDDVACASEPLCAPVPIELCENNLDDDGDGKIDCQDGDCAGLGPCIQVASPGDVVIVEIMIAPAAVAGTAGEWCELLNTTDADIDIAGWVLHDIDQAPQWHVIGGKGPVVIPAGGRLVLGGLADPTANGGVPVDYQWATFGLPDVAGELVLEVKGEQIDVVAYSSPAWPISPGYSLSLDPAHQTSIANDDPLVWCAGAAAYNSMDHGTPGKANPSCP